MRASHRSVITSGNACFYLVSTKPNSMRTITPALIFFLAVGTAQAQWTTDVSSNTTVRVITTGEIGSQLICDGPDGSTYTSWFENGSGSYQLRMQRLDADGVRMWPDSGLVVSAQPQNSAIFRYDLQTDREGNAIVAFQDERTGQLDIVAYKIGPDGSFLWGPDGVELPTPGTTGIGPSVAGLENGNTAIAWTTGQTPAQAAVQLVGPSGTLLMTVPMQISASTTVDRPKPLATTDGGFIIQYEVSNGGFGLPTSNMFAQRFDASGTAVWTNATEVSSKEVAFFFFPHPVSDGQNGFYLTYDSGDPDNPAMTDVYTQRVRGNGTTWSTEGTRMDNSNTTMKFSVAKGLVRLNDVAGLMIPLQVTDASQGQSGISVQRVDTAGTRQLGDASVTVIPVSTDYTSPNDISATVDGAVIIHSSGSFGQQHVAATRVDLSGTPIWSPAQRDISTADSNKGDVAVTSTREDQAVVVWQDDRSPNGIYAQNIAELSTGVASIPFSNTDLRLEQNPTDNPVLLLEQGHGDLSLDVLDAQGRTVYGSPVPSTDRMALPLNGLKAGVYTIRVVGNGSIATVRWVK